jgi:hypothetical protein
MDRNSLQQVSQPRPKVHRNLIHYCTPGDANYFSIFDIQARSKLFDCEPPDRCVGIAWVPTLVGMWLGNQLSNGHILLLNTGFLDRSPLKIETHPLRDRDTNLKGSIAAAQDAGTSLLATSLGTELKVWEVLADGTDCDILGRDFHLLNLHRSTELEAHI